LWSQGFVQKIVLWIPSVFIVAILFSDANFFRNLLSTNFTTAEHCQPGQTLEKTLLIAIVHIFIGNALLGHIHTT
jgi:hypothetical protein